MTRFVLGLAILLACNPAVAQNAQTITVRNLTLVNFTQVPVADYQQIVQFALDNQGIPDTPEIVAQRVRYALQTRGYFRAEVGVPKSTVISQSPTGNVVDLVVQVDPGALYTLNAIQFDGNHGPLVFPEEQLRTQFPISDGELLDTEKIRNGLENLRKLYADHGYINFTPVPNTDVLDQARSVRLRIDVDEGARFYFGDLKLLSPLHHPDAAWTLNSDWSSLRGKPYNGAEMEDFMKQHAEFLSAGFRPERNLEIRQDANTKTVMVYVVP